MARLRASPHHIPHRATKENRAMAFDLSAAVAEKYGDPTPFEFTFAGEDFELPFEPPVTAIAAIDRGDFEPAMRELMGPDQWQRLVDADEVFGIQTLQVLLEEYMEHISSGESSASSGSSKSTGRPSKRTSPAGTKKTSGTSARKR